MQMSISERLPSVPDVHSMKREDQRSDLDLRQLAGLIWAMPALSIRQPWAHHILKNGKDVENRSWGTNKRGWFLIHASKSTEEDAAYIREHKLPLGGIVGAAMIVDCVTWSNNDWFFGPYCFVLRHAFALPFTPCRGQQGFFHPPTEVTQHLTRSFMETLNA